MYPLNHWVLEPCTLADPKMIALAYFEQSDYAVFLNPLDKRGYRSIVRLINNNRMVSTINRDYTSSERIGLALTMALVTEAYIHIVPIAQNAVVGNNAHSFDPKTSIIQLGTREEPVFLHGHVFGRGNPEEKYIENVALDGPIPGVIFDLRAQSSHEPGNNKKVSWKSEEMTNVVARLRTEIENIQDIYKAHGLKIITQNISTDVYLVRHGETDWNIERKLQGHTDNPLNEQGKIQARQLQEKFTNINFKKVFSSDLIRARSTAELILGPNTSTIIETSPLLRERCMGIWEGRLASELQSHLKQSIDLDNLTKEEYITLKWDDTAENCSDVYQRIQTFIRSISISSFLSDGPILLSSHGGVIRSILHHLDFQPGHRWQVSNCAFLKLKVQTDGEIVIMASEGVKLIKAEEAAFSF
jgi:probable phosphoglycerate mutase